MADTAIAITAGTGTNVDTRTESTNGNHRQVIVLGDPATNAGVAPVDATAGLKVDLGADNDVTISGTVTVGSHAVTNAGTFVTQENGAALTALELIDDTVATLGTTTYTEAATKGLTIGAVRRDADTTLVGTTNEVGPLQMDASGRLKVEIFDGGDSHTVDYATTGSGTSTGALRVELPTNGTGVIATVSAVTAITNALPAGTNSIGNVGHNITGIGHGVTTVTTAGTDVALASSTACKRVMIQAQTDNTTEIAVGGSGVDATIATGTGIILYPGGSIDLQIDNLADVFIDAITSGEGVRYTYFT